jgi:opine dehydrogenase
LLIVPAYAHRAFAEACAPHLRDEQTIVLMPGTFGSLEYDLTPANEAFHNSGFGSSGDLWATINGSRMLTALKAPGNLQSRWLTEDIPYGLAAWSKLGAQFDIDTPLMRSFVDIGSIVMGFDGWTEGLGP